MVECAGVWGYGAWALISVLGGAIERCSQLTAFRCWKTEKQSSFRISKTKDTFMRC